MQYNSLENWYNNAFVLVTRERQFGWFEFNSMHPYELEIFDIMQRAQEQKESDEAKARASIDRALAERGLS